MKTINDFMPNSNDWNNERLQTLKQLYPDLFTSEQNLNVQEIAKILNFAGYHETERYEFRWFGKSQAKRNAFTPSNATLVFDEDRSVNPDNTENLIIEGENLEVLKLLSSGYRETIKCIYIDPPYNTGKDFVYSDNFTQDKKGYWEDAEYIEDGVKIDTNSETDGRYHSNWLNMMYSRLLIARQLLREDGVIFISISDVEVHHLRKLCDEVFDENNLLAQFIWRTDGNFDNQAKVKVCHEYILAYCKDINVFPSPPVIDKSISSDSKLFNEEIRNTIVKNGIANPISQIVLPVGFPADFENGIIKKRDNNWPKYLNDAVVKNYKLTNETIIESGWSSKDLALEFIDKRFTSVLDGKLQETNFVISKTGSLEVIKKRSENQSHVISVLSSLGNTQSTSANLKKEEIYFDYPKPNQLLKYLISMNVGNDYLFLDFFGGSGGSGQAIMELNKEDNGNRKFILVQIPEATDEKSEAYKAGYKKISDITIERNKRVVEKIENEIAETEKKKSKELPFDKVAEPTTEYYKPKNNLGFKVFKLQKSNFPRVDFAPDPEKTEAENIELLKTYIATKEAQMVNAFNKPELLTEILLKNGFNLNYKLVLQNQFASNEVQLASDGEKETLICLDVAINPETVDYFKNNNDKKFICLERALDTTKKYNLKHYLGEKFNAF